jgi:hypothetical protein
MAGKVGGVKELSQQLVGSVLDHFHLFEDDLLLPFQVSLVEAGMRQEVGKQIERLRQAVVRNLYGETCHLMGGKSVKVAPQPVGFDRNIARRAALSAFENRMFNEMADAVEFRRLVAGAAPDPDSGGY